MSYKFAIVVRTDLDMRKGKIAAQAGHAVGSMMLDMMSDPELKKNVQEWFRIGNQTKVVLRVTSKEELLAIAEKANNAGLFSWPICDAGHTQVDPGSLTCVGIGPDTDERIDAVTGTLKLL